MIERRAPVAGVIWRPGSSQQVVTMRISIAADVDDMGHRAAACGAERIRAAIAERDSANIIVATGASQFTVLDSLAAADDIAWHRVQVFHLDEYIGLDESHPASFPRRCRSAPTSHGPSPHPLSR